MTRYRTPLVLLLLASCKLGENRAIFPTGGDSPEDPADGSTAPPDGATPGDGDGDGDGDAPTPDGGDGADGDGSTGGDSGDGPDASTPIKPCGGAGNPCTAPSGCTAADDGGHTYFFCPDTQIWADARAACQAAGTDLVIVDSEAENAFVTSQITADSWTGANDIDTEGTMLWIVPGTAQVSGAPISITPPWDDITGHDNCTVGVNLGEQDCLMLTTGGKWNDHGCNAGDCAPGLGADAYGGHRAYVCESF